MKYLASPYSHPDPFIREERYLRAMKVLSDLLEKGEFVYSPIVHCHEFAKIVYRDRVPRFDFWRAYDLHMLSKCDELLVLRIDGWASSVGVTAEIEEAMKLEIPIRWL